MPRLWIWFPVRACTRDNWWFSLIWCFSPSLSPSLLSLLFLKRSDPVFFWFSFKNWILFIPLFHISHHSSSFQPSSGVSYLLLKIFSEFPIFWLLYFIFRSSVSLRDLISFFFSSDILDCLISLNIKKKNYHYQWNDHFHWFLPVFLFVLSFIVSC